MISQTNIVFLRHPLQFITQIFYVLKQAYSFFSKYHMFANVNFNSIEIIKQINFLMYTVDRKTSMIWSLIPTVSSLTSLQSRN